jgi:hypothetical protein
MKVTLTASTGAKILVWREEDVLHSRRAEHAQRKLGFAVGTREASDDPPSPDPPDGSS